MGGKLACPSEALSVFFRRGGFRHVQHLWPNRGPTKRGPQATERRTTARHFLSCEGLFMACGDIHAVQHDNLWPMNTIRLLNSESRISNQVL